MTGHARSPTAMLLAWLRRSPAWRHNSLFLNRSSQSWRGPPAAPAFRNLFLTNRPHTSGALRARQLSLVLLRQLSLTLLLSSFLLLPPSSAYAQYSPGGTCPTIGAATFTNSNPAYLLVCNSSNIWAMGEQFNATGQIGVGQTSIHAALDVNGGVRVGSDITCAVANAGEIIYTSGNVEYCNGSTWITFAASSTTLSGVDVLLLAGSAAAPSLTFQADTTTGLYQSTIDNLFVTTGGTERAVFDSSGNFDITNGSNNSAGGYQINGSGILVFPDKDTTSIAVGQYALNSQSSSSLYNTALGADALYSDTNGSANTGIGYYALYYDSTGASNTSLGAYAMLGVSASPLTGDYNTAVGTSALNAIQGAAAQNTALGFDTLANSTTGSNNTAVGGYALLYNSTGANNTALGIWAMQGASAAPLTGDYNTAVGTAALSTIQGAAAQNTALGFDALGYSTTGSSNTAVGGYAMYGTSAAPLTGNYNTAVGGNALMAITGAAADNTVLGYLAGTAVTSGTDNTLLGYESGYGVSTGTHNIILGEDPSSAITSGSSNILIGNSLSGLTATSNYQLNIGNVVTGTGLGTPSSSTVTIAGNFVVTGSCIGCTGGAALDNVDVELAAGSAAAPSLSFFADTNTGLYQAASHTINFSTNGAEVGAFDTTGDFNLTNGASGTGTGGYQINNINALRFPYGGVDNSSIAVGNSALNSENANNELNVGIGYYALQDNQGGYNNVGVGGYALYDNVGGTDNTAVGEAALFSNTASANTAVGNGALGSITTGGDSTAVGYQALGNATGAPNSALGYSAGQYISSGTNNVAIGYTAMQGTSGALTTGNNNTAVGDSALTQVGGGSADNTAIGQDAMNAGGGAWNTAVGQGAMQSSSGSFNNAVLGFDAAYTMSAGSYNVAVGSNALYSNTTGSSNVAVGNNSLYYTTGNSGAVGIGAGALYTNTTSGSVAVGVNALYYNSTAMNTAVGSNAMAGASASPLTGSENVAIGDSALYKIEGGANNNIAIGYYAMGGQYVGSAATGQYNVAIGSNALNNITSGDDNTAVGLQAGGGITSGSNNTVFGLNALYSVTNGSANTAVGTEALYSATGSPNDALGYFAGQNIGSGNGNLALGYEAMMGTSAHPLTAAPGGNVAVGEYALTSITGASAANTVLGYEAGTAVTSGTDNTLVGYESGVGVTTGTHNIILGEDPSSAITTGSSNIVIGNSLSNVTNSSNHQLDIGDLIMGSISPTSPEVGIGTNTYQGTGLTVSGNVWATQFEMTSDARLKTDIRPLEDVLARLERVKGVTFEWKPPESRTLGKGMSLPLNQPQMGVLAQDVEAAFPQAVATGPDGLKTVNYESLVAPLIEAVKAQQEEIRRLTPLVEQVGAQQEEIKRLELRLDAQKREIDDLKSRSPHTQPASFHPDSQPSP